MTGDRLRKIYFVLLFVTCYLLLVTVVGAEVLDRVVAIVDDEVVMLSELNETFQGTLNSGIDVTREEILDGLINRILLLKQARKIKRMHIFETQTRMEDNLLINEYIEKRIKAFIRIPLKEIERFYEENREYFSHGDGLSGSDNGDIYSVRNKIEIYMTETELNKRLISHLEELRMNANIRVQLQERDE